MDKTDIIREILNSHEVIYIDFSRLPRDCKSYEQYKGRIQDEINTDLLKACPERKLRADGSLWDNLQTVFEQEHVRFILVMDEWDAIFHKGFVTEKDKKNYLEFLGELLKGQAYVEFAYMTGALPIAKYSSGPEINMFKEYDMVAIGKRISFFTRSGKVWMH